MRFLAGLLTTLLLTPLFLSCRRGNGNLSPFGWTPAGGEFDSVTLRLEQLFLDRDNIDSIVRLTGRMRQIADSDSSRPLLDSRATYWEGRLDYTLGNFGEGMERMRLALEKTDSARYPYDYNRILWNLDMDYHEPTVERYSKLVGDLGFFFDAGDLVIAGGLAIELGTFLDDLGATDEGEPYLFLADSLFIAAGRPEQAANNRINHANVLRIKGDSLGAERYFRRLLADTVMPLSPYARDIALGNLYSLADDTLALLEAYSLIEDEPDMQEERFLYESFLAGEAINRRDLPEARRYMALATANRPYAQTPEFIRDYYQQRYRLHELEGQTDSAFRYLLLTARLNDSINTSNNRVEVRNATLAGHIRLLKQQADIERRNSTIMFLIVSFSLLLLLIAVSLLFWRRLQRQKLARMKDQLEKERVNRKMLAMELVIKEKDKLFDTVGQEMSQLSEAGEISPLTAGRIESSLKAHSGMKPHRDNFLETFGELSPDFESRLRESCPALTEADIRLAAYIALGLENKHIASVMGIRPESVKQARWRLRSKLSLPRNASLEETLRSLSQPGR